MTERAYSTRRSGTAAMFGLLAVSLLAPACGPQVTRPTFGFQLAPSAAALTIRLGSAARALQYLRATDWETAVGELNRAGDPPISLAVTATAAIAADGRGRSAILTFPSVDEGSGYSLRVSLRKRGPDGQDRVLGTLEEPGLTLAAGPNTLTLGSIPEARETPVIPPTAGLGPYVTSIPGAGVSASLADAQDVVAVGDGRYYFLDNGRLGLMYTDSAGVPSTRTLAGIDKRQGAGLVDGVGAAARFNDPRHLAVAPDGTIYVADAGSHAIRRVVVDAKGQATVTTVAGSGVPGATDGPAASATFRRPTDIAVDADGSLIVADTDNHRIRKVQFGAQGAVVSTLAGTGTAGYFDGPGELATFRQPGAVCPGPAGVIYVGDSRNFRVRTVQIDAAGQATVGTLAGSGLQAGFQASPVDDDGPGASARFGSITSLRRAPDGTLYANDLNLRRIDVAAGSANVSTIGISGTVVSDFPRDALSEFSANGMAFDANGAVLLASKRTIKRIEVSTPGTTAIRKWLGEPIGDNLPLDGPARYEKALIITGMALDGAGNLYLAAASAIYMVPGSDLLAAPTLIAGHPTLTGRQDGVGGAARFLYINCLCVLPDGSILATDFNDHVIRRLVPGANGQFTVSTFAGTAGARGFRNGAAADALFNKVGYVVRHPSGRLYVSDNANFVIREVAFDVDGAATIRTVAGREPPEYVGLSTATQPGYADGPATSALMKPVGFSVDPAGDLIITDDFIRLRKLAFRPSGDVVTTLAGASTTSLLNARSVDGVGEEARFVFAQETAVAPDGTIYVADDKKIRKVVYDAQGRAVVSTFLGEAIAGTRDGPADLAGFGEFNTSVTGVRIASNGDLYVTEWGSLASTSRVRRISSIPLP